LRLQHCRIGRRPFDQLLKTLMESGHAPLCLDSSPVYADRVSQLFATGPRHTFICAASRALGRRPSEPFLVHRAAHAHRGRAAIRTHQGCAGESPGRATDGVPVPTAVQTACI
jgi:hypothetical protein